MAIDNKTGDKSFRYNYICSLKILESKDILKKSCIFCASSIFYLFHHPVYAICDTPGHYYQARDGSVCDYDLTTPGTQLISIDGNDYVSLPSNGPPTSVVLAQDSGTVLNMKTNSHFDFSAGGLRSTIIVRRGAKLNVLGNLHTTMKGATNGRAFIVQDVSGAHILGDLYAFRSGAGGSATAEVEAQSTLRVDGNGYIYSDSVPATQVFRQYGNSVFHGNLEVVLDGGSNSPAMRSALRNRGDLEVGGTLRIKATDAYAIEQLYSSNPNNVIFENKIVADKLVVTTYALPDGSLSSSDSGDAYRIDTGSGDFRVAEINAVGRGIVFTGDEGQLNFGMGSNAVVTDADKKAALGIGSGAIINSDKIAILFDGPTTSYTLIDDGAKVVGKDKLYSSERGDSTLVLNGGAIVAGSIFMGDGTSSLILRNNVDLTGVPVLDGGDDLSGADGTVDTITFQNFSSSLPGGKLLNWEKVVLDNSHLNFSDDALTTGSEEGLGLFVKNNSVLSATTSFVLDGNMHLGKSGSFHGQGHGAGVYAIGNNVNNSGVISLSNNGVGDVFHVLGNYSGDKGAIVLDTRLADDNAVTDKVLIQGDTSGATDLTVVNKQGVGDLTKVDGIKLIHVDGLSQGVFALNGDYVHNDRPVVVGGAYAYSLYQGGVNDPDDGHWYLRSEFVEKGKAAPEPSVKPKPAYQAGVPVYEVYPQFLLGLNELSTWQRRLGNRFWNGAGAVESSQLEGLESQSGELVGPPLIEGSGLWGRVEGRHMKFKPRSSTTGADFDYDSAQFQFGLDKLMSHSKRGKMVGGLNARYIYGESWIHSEHGKGKIKTSGYGVGGTLTWYGENNVYSDNQIQFTWYDSDLSSNTARRSLVDGNRGFGYALSSEVGKRYALNNQWFITPQFQLTYSHADFDGFKDTFGAGVSRKKAESLQARLGGSLSYQKAWIGTDGKARRSTAYGKLNLINEFLNKTEVRVSAVPVSRKVDRQWLELGVGGTYNWNGDQHSIYGELAARTSAAHFGDSYGYRGMIGLRVQW